MTAAIQAEGLTKQYGASLALTGVDLAVEAGTVFGLLGPNGAGKTTTVRILATLLRPDRGQARVAGFDIGRQAHEVRRRIGLTGQYAAVDENLTGAENLYLIGRLVGLPGSEARQRAADLLARFDLADAGRRFAKTYSGGMRRRLDLAAGLTGRPQVLFLDEPTTGLDPRSRAGLWTVIRELVADGTIVLLTTQYLEEADQLADRIAVIDHGRVIAEGTADDLKTRAGGQVLEARPADPADLGRAGAILADLTGACCPVDYDTRLVSTPITDSAWLPVVVRRLDQAGIAVAELALRRPSLDEVFLSLTGHPTEPAASRSVA